MTPRPPSAPADHAGARFRDLRIRDGLTQVDVAAILGVGQVRVSEIETWRRPVGLDALHEYATALGWDPHDLDPRLASNRGAEG